MSVVGERVGEEAIHEAHLRAIEAGEPGYSDPTTGNFVFTAVELMDRGYCCGSGCRHCPYGTRDDGA